MPDRFAKIKRFIEGTGSHGGRSGDVRGLLLAKDFMKCDLTGSARFYAR